MAVEMYCLKCQTHLPTEEHSHYGLHPKCFKEWFNISDLAEFISLCPHTASDKSENAILYNTSFFNGKFKKCILFCLLLTSLPIYAEDKITQAGTVLNLMQGIYTGSTTFAELEKIGDFGLGTSNGLSGELVVIEKSRSFV